MADDLLNEVIRILRDRDVPYDREALRSALRDPGSQTAVREWMEEYLSPDILLTKDEAAIYAYLSKTGEADRLAAQDLSAVQGLNDSEIQNAIEELKRSTAAIEKQSETLRLQQNAMSALVKSEQRISQLRSQTNNGQLKKWNAEKSHIEDLSQSLAYQTSDLEQQSLASEASLKQTVDNILKSDDKLLASLQKLASDLDPINSEDEEVLTRIRDLCAKLIKHTVEGIRTRLDRIYLESLDASSEDTLGQGDSQESQDLQEELESLYSEILPVAQMSAEQQFLQPALRTIAATKGQGQERAVKAVKYARFPSPLFSTLTNTPQIHKCLIFLVTRIETFLARTKESQIHKMALNFVLSSARQELSRVEEVSPLSSKNAASPSNKPNTQRRRTSSSNQSPIRARNARRRSSGIFENEDVDPEQQLARNLGISLPTEPISDAARAEMLEKTLADRVLKLDIHANSLQQTTELAISSHLLDANLTLQLLQDSLLAETMHGKVRLLDPDIESSVTMFEQEIEDLEAALEGVDLGLLSERNVKREEIVGRWSR
ncbi:hypothetical protein G7Y89_g1879 [Cudoniella acicularis]|uniref:Uncharacterized protein n=1 Tax=Cudoniella acicularis TaxID=354080 RepID=A0A8H4W9W1_9HELO|nr:hypothetical protein G7Y89_g1879 [Cudoniella acicularis]